MNWSDAKAHCSSLGYRLPTVKELSTLVDLTVTPGPKIDQTAFPDTPATSFWTSSPYAGSPSAAWGVSFKDGSSNRAIVSSNYRVRCIR